MPGMVFSVLGGLLRRDREILHSNKTPLILRCKIFMGDFNPDLQRLDFWVEVKHPLFL